MGDLQRFVDSDSELEEQVHKYPTLKQYRTANMLGLEPNDVKFLNRTAMSARISELMPLFVGYKEANGGKHWCTGNQRAALKKYAAEHPNVAGVDFDTVRAPIQLYSLHASPHAMQRIEWNHQDGSVSCPQSQISYRMASKILTFTSRRHMETVAASQPQLQTLAAMNYEGTPPTTMAEASTAIQTLKRKAEDEPADESQLRRLQRVGHRTPPGAGLTRRQAEGLMRQLNA